MATVALVLSRRGTQVLDAVLLVCAAGLLVGAVLGQDGWRIALYAGLLVVLGAGAVRRRGDAARQERSAAAAASWTPQRVDEVVADVGGDRIAAVRALRRADPALSLVDAVELVTRRERHDGDEGRR